MVYHYAIPTRERLGVGVGTVTRGSAVTAEVADVVMRYLLDQTADLLSRHDVFNLVEGGPANVDVDLVKLQEKSGLTIVAGPLSSQKEHAEVTLKVTLRPVGGGHQYTSTQTGKSSKGAWGVIATVNRDAMLKKEGVWKLDETMLGNACMEALQKGIRCIALQVVADIKAQK